MRRSYAIIAGLLATAPAVHAEQSALTLKQALDTARRRAPDLAIAAQSEVGAVRRRTAAKRTRLPSLSVQSAVNVWTEELAFDLGVDPMTGMASSVVVREQITSQSNVSISLPLSGQLVLSHYIDAAEANSAAIKADSKTTALDVQQRTAETYLALLAAQGEREIADAVVRQREAQLARAKVLQGGGVLQRVDVMRLEAAVAEAKRAEIAARTRAASVADALAVTIGAPGRTLSAIDDFPKQPQAPAAQLGGLPEKALANRPELVALRARVRAARSSAKVERAPLYPTINAVGTFQYNTGQGPFLPKSAFFAGLTLEWNLWDWGQTWNKVKAAEADATRAQLQGKQVADNISLDTRTRLREANASYESLRVAEVGSKAAEEAFRIQSVRFQEGATTTTELLEAETEVTRARLGLNQARYTYYIALTRLARAAGLTPSELLP
ncbi:MAG: TolC family protein [Deltaproteobacteria bacterium]|nr:TolC family protein [Deltaproteobacteria bacterium]